MKKIKIKKEAVSIDPRPASRSQNFIIPLDERNAYHCFRLDSRPLHIERLSFLEAPNGFYPKGPNGMSFNKPFKADNEISSKGYL